MLFDRAKTEIALVLDSKKQGLGPVVHAVMPRNHIGLVLWQAVYMAGISALGWFRVALWNVLRNKRMLRSSP